MTMNWYRSKILKIKEIAAASLNISSSKKRMIKLAYMTKGHQTQFNDTDSSDGYHCKIALTESKKKIVLTSVFLNDIHAFPLYSETWIYPKKESRRAIKTFNKCVNLVEDIKAEYEDEDMPGPTLQGMARETLRYVDIDRKKPTISRSLEAAKYLDGETDWRSSIYGNRWPSQYPTYSPTINIHNTGDGTVNYNEKK